jgi:hypothetical protein
MAGKHRFDELEAVVEQQCDSIARPDAMGAQGAGESPRPVVEFGVGAPLSPKDEGRPLGVGAPAPADHLWDHERTRPLQSLASTHGTVRCT